jgi:small-conductance mechanosensitive channel
LNFDTLETFVSRLKEAAAWIPPWIIDAAVLILAAIAALIAYAILVRLATRGLGARHPYVALLLRQTQGPVRLALIIFALNAAIPAVSLTPDAAAALRHALQIGFILLLGWIAVSAIHLASTFYLRRFELGATDNLLARKHLTQVNMLRRAADLLIVVVTIAAALMTFESVRQYGVSLFASAGAAGLILGLAARPVLSNLIAGIQIAMTQPIRIDDALIVENEMGNVEEITSTYVVVRLWDWRRLIVPLNYFIEKPFQNWTRETSALIGTVYLFVDYSVPVERLRDRLKEILAGSKLWDGQVANVQVTEATDRAVQLRILVSARNAASAWDLRCEVREKLIAFLQADYPDSLPRVRQEAVGDRGAKAVPEKVRAGS